MNYSNYWNKNKTVLSKCLNINNSNIMNYKMNLEKRRFNMNLNYKYLEIK